MSSETLKDANEAIPSPSKGQSWIHSRITKITAMILVPLASILAARHLQPQQDPEIAIKEERQKENAEFLEFLQKKVAQAKAALISSGAFPSDLQASDFEPEEVTTYVVHSLHMQYKAAYIATRSHLIQSGDITGVAMNPRKAATISDRMQYRYKFQKKESERLNSLPITDELISAARNHKKGYTLLPVHPSLYGVPFIYDPIEGFLEDPNARE